MAMAMALVMAVVVVVVVVYDVRALTDKENTEEEEAKEERCVWKQRDER